MHGDTDGMALEFLENKLCQNLPRHLNQQRKVQLSITEAAKHFLRGHIVKLNAHASARQGPGSTRGGAHRSDEDVSVRRLPSRLL
jgi:hypothetical protein